MNHTAKTNLDVCYCPINDQLKAYCLQGIIPGPEESEDSFFKRAKKLTNADAETPKVRAPYLQKAFQSIYNLYGVSHINVKLFHSNAKLMPWEGGATWISDNEVSIQLPRRRYWLARSDYTEIITHEFVHVMRQKFDEPIFEELIAYQSSPKYWRRILGPFLAQSWRCFLLLGSFVLGQIADWYSLSCHWTPIITALATFPLAILTSIRHYQFQKVKKMMESSFRPSFANFAMLFLTDREIIRFAQSDPAKICKYLKSGKSLRLRSLSLFIP
ncbi:MAG: hypothetical protein H7A40_04710 [Chlamydiales bacterium]|nr:hypothetical protein [Chlamydiales bacterium]